MAWPARMTPACAISAFGHSQHGKRPLPTWEALGHGIVTTYHYLAKVATCQEERIYVIAWTQATQCASPVPCWDDRGVGLRWAGVTMIQLTTPRGLPVSVPENVTEDVSPRFDAGQWRAAKEYYA